MGKKKLLTKQRKNHDENDFCERIIRIDFWIMFEKNYYLLKQKNF